ncbi:metal ABC transporter ATP-binding protein [Cryomorpha ignava]|uniref:Metal ABC transporter ATP-binding protein n=1 Tax=Cryomorpha ignava TaxID=101383 RepID=A0A7K3WR35_9FLAO|nr:metal ABC transporter ATP-binding protein [Cryomorpha ignava]NEN24137.1 metal ABC transporter ATP-binding protein [Cryomorpha ignava]
MTVLEAHNLTVSYDKQPVLWDIDFEVPEGKLVGIIGPNGSGKTTLLKAAMGLLPADSGYVKVFGKPIDEVRERMSYVPQRQSVDWDFPATVMDVCKMGRYRQGKLFGRLSKLDKEIAADALERVGMTAYKNRQIGELSGGQQQRVFIARSLAQQADLYLMDEPFVGIDAASESAIIKLLEDMRSEGKTVVLVHHDLHTAIEFFDWIVLLNTRLVASGPKVDVLNEENLRVAYGGKLTLLNRVAELVRKEEFPIREKKKVD